MATILDVAAYILSKRRSMSTMKLQKLCFYSQGWSLAWDEKPLFSDEFQAWANGPVSPALFDKHRGLFRADEGDIPGDPDALDADSRETIDAVLEAYGDLSGQQLSDKTHSERPWCEARGDLEPGAWCRKPVSTDVMQEFFGGLALAAER